MQYDMLRKPFTLLIHIALVIIMAGAIVTHYCGIQGELSLSEHAGPVSEFVRTSGPGDGRLPFAVELEAAEIDYYPGTATPMDFRSRLLIDGKRVAVSMNRVAVFEGWRFYQSGISQGATRLSVSHDPAGTGITYLGYGLLVVGMAGFFFQRNTPWRALLRNRRKFMAGALLLCAMSVTAGGQAPLPAMQRPLAAGFGKIHVYWNDRVCPLQTMARDVTMKLYGSESYCGMTSEQVLSGWIFYFDTWERDYMTADTSDKDVNSKNRAEQLALIRWMGTGEAFRIYPYRSAAGHTEWLSLTGRRPSRMDLGQWKYMQTTMPRIKELLLAGRNIDANTVIDSLYAGQIRYAGAANLPTHARMEAERFYNRYASMLVPAAIALILGAFYFCVALGKRRPARPLALTATALSVAVAVYLLSLLVLLWWIGGHIPVSNGPEMMLFMGFMAAGCALSVRNRLLKGAFLIVAAMTLAVAFMCGRTPRIGMLMPVLSSPLLSVHVMLVMAAYLLFLIMAVLAAAGLWTRKEDACASLFAINRVILVPAVFLLGAGIIVGAVWANQSWGRYWGWDPKETCALVMFLIYSVPVHWASRRMSVFQKQRVFQYYILFAALSVLFTYFGANYFLKGLHSYA